MVFDRGGNLFVSDYASTFITKFSPSGVSSVFATGLSSPSGLAFDGAGNLYAANFTANTIMKFTPGGVGSVFASTGLNGPMGLAFDSSGNLYAANYYGNTITTFTLGGAGSVFANSGLTNPWGLAFDSTDNLFVTNFWGNNIRKITPGGVGSVFATVTATHSSLRYLAFDIAGNLYATDYDKSTIMKFEPSGASSVLANLGMQGMSNPVGIAIQIVPEPSALALGSLGLLGLMVLLFHRLAHPQSFRRFAFHNRQVRRVRLHPRRPVEFRRPPFDQPHTLAQLLPHRRERPFRSHAKIQGDRRKSLRALLRLLFK